MANKFTPKAQWALESALKFASDMGHTYIGSEHLLMGLLSAKDGAAAKILNLRGLRAADVKDTVAEITGVGTPMAVSPSDMTPRVKKILEQSAHESVSRGQSYVGTEHLLLSMLSDRDCVAVRIIESLGVSVSEIRQDIESYVDSSPSKKESAKAQQSPKSGVASFGRDLCKMARDGKIDPVIGRERETERVIQILSRRQKNNPCLIGEPGVGKTAVVEGLAERIVDGDVPDALRGKRVVSLDLASMIAGAKYRGEFEERLKSVLAEAQKDPELIIFIDEIHTIIGAGAAEGAVDAANIIKPALSRGELQVIGATTLNEYRRHIEKDSALERRFQSVTVGEPTREESIAILKGLRQKYESHHKLTVSDGAIEAAVDLSVRYINDRYLPDKALDLIDEAAARLRLRMFTSPPEQRELEEEIRRLGCEKAEAITEQNFEAAAAIRDREAEARQIYECRRAEWEKRKEIKELTLSESDVADVVTQWTGIPVHRLLEDESQRLSALEEKLKSRVIGQDTAAAAVSSAILRGRMGLKDPGRPIGSFIFAGRTGVGKTELCRALADQLFGSEDAMIRLDMSEYMEKHSVSKLIGSPPGYVGYEEGGLLTERIRRRPYSIVLFDEIEKAHPDVFNLLLQILEDGRLTDSQGRRVSFNNSIIIMTTNLGSAAFGETGRMGFTSGGADSTAARERERVENDLKRTFKPEFLNRIDEIVHFKPLGQSELVRISSLMLSSVADRIESTGVFIEFDDGIAEFVAERSNSTEYGARELRRTIIKEVETKYSEAMLRGEFKKGDFIRASVSDGCVVFSKKRKESVK